MSTDIHALEIEFAKNPTLDSCIPLCNAYLSAKRYMEAMVVCKKGIKNTPQDPRGRVMLATVYQQQGKAPKAEQELTAALTEFPGNPAALTLLARMRAADGRRDEAVGMLQQVLQGDPSFADARTLLQQLGVQPPAPVAAPVAKPPPVMQQPPMMQPPPMGAPRMAQPPPGFAAPRGAPGMAHGGQMPPWAGPPPQPLAEVGSTSGARPLEHVSDFFAPDTLGFATDGGDIETAGPGRLTILGFVPKTTGSIKTTIVVLLGLLAVGGAYISWQYISAQNTKRINKLFGEVRVALDEDRYPRYQDAIRRCEEILTIDAKHNLALSAMGYAYAVLGTDHNAEGAIPQAQAALKRALDASDSENEYRVAARALLAYATKQYEQGIADVKKILDKGGSSPIIELEAFRLMQVAHPETKETQIQMRRVIQSVVSQARVFNFLGWYYYAQDDWPRADENFDKALQNAKGHPLALIGQALTDLDRGLGLKERQREIAQRIKQVFSLPRDDLSPPILALAHFARGQLSRWQGNTKEAEQDYAAAFKLNPDNPMFYYRRGMAALKRGDALAAIDDLKAVVAKDPNNTRYYKALAEAQTVAGQLKEAKASLDRARQLAPQDVSITLLEGDRLAGQKQFDDAIAIYKSITVEAGADPYATAQIGISKALRDGGNKAKAVKHMEDVLANAPAGVTAEMQAKLWCELGVNYDATRNKDKAMQSFTVGIEQYRFYADCHYYAC
ncbi:MAG: tetratricopeptide repeat protein, partial [Myxococcota bacterium]